MINNNFKTQFKRVSFLFHGKILFCSWNVHLLYINPFYLDMMGITNQGRRYSWLYLLNRKSFKYKTLPTNRYATGKIFLGNILHGLQGLGPKFRPFSI